MDFYSVMVSILVVVKITSSTLALSSEKEELSRRVRNVSPFFPTPVIDPFTSAVMRPTTAIHRESQEPPIFPTPPTRSPTTLHETQANEDNNGELNVNNDGHPYNEIDGQANGENGGPAHEEHSWQDFGGNGGETYEGHSGKSSEDDGGQTYRDQTFDENGGQIYTGNSEHGEANGATFSGNNGKTYGRNDRQWFGNSDILSRFFKSGRILSGEQFSSRNNGLTTNNIYVADPSEKGVMTVNVYLPEEDYTKCLSKVSARIPQGSHTNAAAIWCLRLLIWRTGVRDPEKRGSPDYGVNDRGEMESDQLAQTRSENKPVKTISSRKTNVSKCDLLQYIPQYSTRPDTGFRIRKEYRALTQDERNRFHAAMNSLYSKGIIDCFSILHREAMGGAHKGPAFLPWHRVFLALFEEALRREDPIVAVPYWDSSIDYNMQSPLLSVMWDDDHMGPGTGEVISGPFAGWFAVNSPLSRDIANGAGSLIRNKRIKKVMKECYLSEFDGPWEQAHNGVHRWVGGIMARGYAASDPIFYLHHAFVDYQWEKFRKRQNSSDCLFIDPTQDYPETDDLKHQGSINMDGIEFFQNREGMAEYWTQDWYNYEDTPKCANDCANSPDLECNVDSGHCVSRERLQIDKNVEYVREKRHAVFRPPFRQVCRYNPYARYCPGPPGPKSWMDRVMSMARNEEPMSYTLEHVSSQLREERIQSEINPPPLGKILFEAAVDETGDCRTYETAVLEILETERKDDSY